MRKRVKLLSLAVAMTVSLLAMGATLVVLGIFDEILNWDLFSYQVEQVLTGIFFASVALSIFGVAIVFVLGIQEIVRSIDLLQKSRGLDEFDAVPEAPKTTYLLYMAGLVAVFSALIGFLSFTNYRITAHRTKVFKRIATEQMQGLKSQFVQEISRLEEPPEKNVPQTLNDLIKSVEKLSFVNSLTLYLPDTEDEVIIWSYDSWEIDNKDENGFDRYLVAKEYEQAIQSAFQGKPELLQALNGKTGFQWYYLIRNAQNQPIAVLRIDGNSSENFREYKLGS
ncbi:hypothetical protein [Lyngbya sp. CCY1209]|uniref:hypothetical protein n=1 Tax=Lyngbya sp. CCY1209 TaxID=2886103 RepID=UPI002D20303A|nr:hypothetical protein [Lyngbya sp. CCY1209]MEB3885179.1 hypothetical protein [Lyngbya sp. CCY1209]